MDDRFYVVDLPGYGYARASKADRARYLELLQGYLSERPGLAGVVWLVDARRDPTADDRAMAQRLAVRSVPVLLAVTKADKVGRARRGERLQTLLAATQLPEDQCVVTSARKREGVEELRQAIEALVTRRGGGLAAGR